MRIKSTLLWGALTGNLLLLIPFVLVLILSWSSAQGQGDVMTQKVLSDYRDLLTQTSLKFLALHILAGSILGAFSALCVALFNPKSKPLFLSFVAALLLTLYLNLRLLLIKPIFYDSLLNAQGGMGQWIQNSLTDFISPLFLDLLTLIIFILLLIKKSRLRSCWTPCGLFACFYLVINLFTAMEKTELKPEDLVQSVNRSNPNILILATDSLRPDHLSFTGYKRNTSPNLDLLAQRSIVFEQAYVPLARTLPSWASFFTSTYPHTHGFRHMFPQRRQKKIHAPLLPRILSQQGYKTEVISDYAGECFNMVDMGFDWVDAPPCTSMPIVIDREFFHKFPYLTPFIDNFAGRRLLPLMDFLMVNPDPLTMSSRVIKRMEAIKKTGKPFFITAFYSCTHIPYSIPYPFYKKFTDPKYQGPHKYGFGVTDARKIKQAYERPPLEDQEHIKNLYDGGVAAFDQEVGRLLLKLKSLGLLENTLILITSDHGENLYDNNNLLEHGECFGGGDGANRIPFIYYDPSRKTSKKISDLVSSLDLAPTLLCRLGYSVPVQFQGRDLAPLMDGKKQSKRPVMGETGFQLAGSSPQFKGSDLVYPSILFSLKPDRIDQSLYLDPSFERVMVKAKQRQIRTEKFKLIYSPVPKGVKFMLFDLEKDPNNLNNLYDKKGYETIGKTLKMKLFNWMLQEPGSKLDRHLHLIRSFSLFE